MFSFETDIPGWTKKCSNELQEDSTLDWDYPKEPPAQQNPPSPPPLPPPPPASPLNSPFNAPADTGHLRSLAQSSVSLKVLQLKKKNKELKLLVRHLKEKLKQARSPQSSTLLTSIQTAVPASCPAQNVQPRLLASPDSTDVSSHTQSHLPPPDPQAPHLNCPFGMEAVDTPEFSTIACEIKFKPSQHTFPHGLYDYFRTKERLVPHVEQRRPIIVSFKLVNQLQPLAMCSELDLCADRCFPEKIYFKLVLIYDDDGTVVSPVTLLPSAAANLKAISTPDILNSEKVQMINGRVTFKLKSLLVYSSMTNPMHRKFRFKLICVDNHMSSYITMHPTTVAFYSVSKLNPERVISGEPLACGLA